MLRSVDIVGYGSFGKLAHTLLQRFAPDIEVCIFSSRAQPDSETFFSLEEVAQCDAVILAVPIHVFEEHVQNIMPLVRPETVLVDVSTVKMHTGEILRRVVAGRPYLATHPMWGPESYQKRDGDVAGFRIVVTEHTLTQEIYAALRDTLEKIGFSIVEMSAEQHDRHLAETLFLTHFIGQIIAKGGFGRTEIDTVSFGSLMDAVESVKHDTALFRDVCAFNPFCEEVLERLEIAEQDVHALLEKRGAYVRA